MADVTMEISFIATSPVVIYHYPLQTSVVCQPSTIIQDIYMYIKTPIPFVFFVFCFK